jgi:hypothetical protein
MRLAAANDKKSMLFERRKGEAKKKEQILIGLRRLLRDRVFASYSTFEAKVAI